VCSIEASGVPSVAFPLRLLVLNETLPDPLTPGAVAADR